MAKKEVSFSDLSDQVGGPDGLVPLLVTDYPDSDLDERKRIEVTRDEFARIGGMAIKTVGLETEPTEEQTRRTRLVVPIGDLATLATVGPIEEILANAETVAPPRKQSNGDRRSHNRTASGDPLVNYNDPANSGLHHLGRVGKQEAAFVRENLQLVNERRAVVGQPPISPENPADAKRYGFISSDASEPADIASETEAGSLSEAATDDGKSAEVSPTPDDAAPETETSDSLSDTATAGLPDSEETVSLAGRDRGSGRRRRS